MTIFGANWRTSLSGLITLITAAISFKPELVNFLPHTVQVYVVGVSNFIVFASGGAFVLAAKDKKVTGGAVQQTLKGNVAEEGTQTLVDLTLKASKESGEKVPTPPIQPGESIFGGQIPKP